MFFRAVVNWAGDKSKGKQNSYDFAVDLANHFKYQHTDWICNLPPTKDQIAKQMAEWVKKNPKPAEGDADKKNAEKTAEKNKSKDSGKLFFTLTLFFFLTFFWYRNRC
jgi:hypothetical protein